MVATANTFDITNGTDVMICWMVYAEELKLIFYFYKRERCSFAYECLIV